MSPMKNAFLAAMVLSMAASAGAQDAPKVGLAMGYPSSVGVLWRVADNVALRPEITLSHLSGDSTGTDLLGPAPPVTANDGTGVGVALGALFYVGRKDAFRAYVSPKFSYSRSTTSSTTPSNTILGPSTTDSTSNAYSVTGSFGAEYSLNRRFAVFGELGASYTRSETSLRSSFTIGTTTFTNGVLTVTNQLQTTQAGSHSNAVGTRTAAGVIVFF
jgi:hypothetical protein